VSADDHQQPGGRFLFVLVQDMLPDEAGAIYAPSRLGVYPLHDEGWFEIPGQAIDDRSVGTLVPDETGRIPLSRLRDLLETLDRERAEYARQVNELVRASRAATDYPTVRELPPEPESGGRPGEIDRPTG